MIGDAAIPQMNPKKDKNGVARPVGCCQRHREQMNSNVRRLTLAISNCANDIAFMRGENLSRAEAGKFLAACLILPPPMRR